VILRDLAAVLGGVIVVFAGVSVIGTVIVPRPVRSWLTASVDWFVRQTFWGLTYLARGKRQRDAVLAAQAAAILMMQLVGWLLSFILGFALLLLPFDPRGFGHALAEAGSDMSTIGFSSPAGAASRAIAVLSAFAALGTLALQIGYLPALYGAYNRRETAVALLTARAGVPTWGPELLARTHYGLGAGSTIATLPDLYAEWERWSADVTETHTTYLPLVYFRSPRQFASWVTGLLGVLDSAALYLALCPSTAPVIPARLCLRGGFTCFTRIALAMGVDVPEEADPATGISLTYEDFLEAISRLRSVDFPLERSPEEAWPHFVGWRVNYERAAFAVAWRVSAPAAMWSGPRRRAVRPIAPLRPPDYRPDDPPRSDKHGMPGAAAGGMRGAGGHGEHDAAPGGMRGAGGHGEHDAAPGGMRGAGGHGEHDAAAGGMRGVAARDEAEALPGEPAHSAGALSGPGVAGEPGAGSSGGLGSAAPAPAEQSSTRT